MMHLNVGAVYKHLFQDSSIAYINVHLLPEAVDQNFFFFFHQLPSKSLLYGYSEIF